MKVLFLSLDTLRADRLGCLGYPRRLTPNLDRLAGEGVAFEQAFATDIPTQPSHTALFTGRAGINTGIVSHFHPGSHLNTAEPWLPSILQSAGCATGAVDHLFTMKDWFVRGYDDYMVPPGRSRASAKTINEFAMPWLTDHKDEDFFLFLHYWDAHIPYVPPEPYKSRHTTRSAQRRDPLIQQLLRGRPTYHLFQHNLYKHLGDIPNLDYIADLYDAEIEYLDAEIGRLVDHLADLSILDDTLIVTFADHGENMTEHDAWFDHAGLYDSVVHVPLVMRGPGIEPSGLVSPQVALVDVFPTVLELLGLPPVADRDGRSLLPVMRGEDVDGRRLVFLSECTWQATRGVRSSQWKFIRTYQPGVYPRDGEELYHLAADPEEQDNVLERYPEVASTMGELLDSWVRDATAERSDPFDQVISVGLPAVLRLDGMVMAPAPPPPLPGEPVGPPLASTVPFQALPPGRENQWASVRAAPATGGTRADQDRGSNARRILLVSAAAAIGLGALGVTVEKTIIASPVQVAGVVLPQSVAQLNFAAAGTVTDLAVSPGQTVSAGQVLAVEDATPIQGQLAADQAKLAADQAKLQQDQAPAQPAQAAVLANQVAAARTALGSDQTKVADVTANGVANVQSAQTAVDAAQATLTTDQQTQAKQCADPSASACADAQHQVAADQAGLSNAEAALAQAEAQRQQQIDVAGAAVAGDQAALATAQANYAAGTQPGTPAQVAADQAAVAADQAAVTADQHNLDLATIKAPFDGVVGAVGGVTGDLDASDGVHQAMAQNPVPQAPSSGIALFPQAPQQQLPQSASLEPLVTLDSFQERIVAQVSEADISKVHTGHKATITLPALPGRTFTAVVSQVQPSAIVESGQAYYLVDLRVVSNPVRRKPRAIFAAASSRSALGPAQPAGATTVTATTLPSDPPTKVATRSSARWSPPEFPFLTQSSNEAAGDSALLTGMSADVDF